MKRTNHILSLPPEAAKQVIVKLATINPQQLAAFFSKIRTQECPDDTLLGMCWIWTGSMDTGNRTMYGKIKVKGKMKRAHRWIFDVLVRPLRVDEDAHHMCEESRCVNPFHIEAVPCEKHSRRGPPVNWSGDVEVPF